jgi:hypothetical protein
VSRLHSCHCCPFRLPFLHVTSVGIIFFYLYTYLKLFHCFQGTARLMFNSFASSLWLMPFSKYCKADNIYWKHFFEGKGGCAHRQQCDEMEYISHYSGWPTDLVNIEVPTVRGSLYKSLCFLM